MKRNRLKNVLDQGKRGTKRTTDEKIGLKNRNIVGISAPPLAWINWNGVATRWCKSFEDIYSFWRNSQT